MTDYHAMYLKLATATANAVEQLEATLAALKQAQLEAEAVYMEGEDPKLTLFENGPPEGKQSNGKG